MIDPEERITIYSDSNLCVRTLNEWAAGWERRGWRRKSGPVENLDLVRRAYELKRSRPLARLVWIKAHDGSRFNEYADALAVAALKGQA
jgi:ribonuclease HI